MNKKETSFIIDYAHFFAGLAFLLAILNYYDELPLYAVFGNVMLGFVFLTFASDHCTPYRQIYHYLKVPPSKSRLAFKVLAIGLIILSMLMRWMFV